MQLLFRNPELACRGGNTEKKCFWSFDLTRIIEKSIEYLEDIACGGVAHWKHHCIKHPFGPILFLLHFVRIRISACPALQGWIMRKLCGKMRGNAEIMRRLCGYFLRRKDVRPERGGNLYIKNQPSGWMGIIEVGWLTALWRKTHKFWACDIKFINTI